MKCSICRVERLVTRLVTRLVKRLVKRLVIGLVFGGVDTSSTLVRSSSERENATVTRNGASELLQDDESDPSVHCGNYCVYGEEDETYGHDHQSQTVDEKEENHSHRSRLDWVEFVHPENKSHSSHHKEHGSNNKHKT